MPMVAFVGLPNRRVGLCTGSLIRVRGQLHITIRFSNRMVEPCVRFSRCLDSGCDMSLLRAINRSSTLVRVSNIM